MIIRVYSHHISFSVKFNVYVVLPFSGLATAVGVTSTFVVFIYVVGCPSSPCTHFLHVTFTVSDRPVGSPSAGVADGCGIRYT